MQHELPPFALQNFLQALTSADRLFWKPKPAMHSGEFYHIRSDAVNRSWNEAILQGFSEKTRRAGTHRFAGSRYGLGAAAIGSRENF